MAGQGDGESSVRHKAAVYDAGAVMQESWTVPSQIAGDVYSNGASKVKPLLQSEGPDRLKLPESA